MRDGPGADIDFIVDNDGYAANWNGINWTASSPDPVDGDELRYVITLEYWNGSSWQPVSSAGGQVSAQYNPDYPDATPATSFSKNYGLDRGTRYRVKVVAEHEYDDPTGSGTTTNTSAPAYSDGFLVRSGADAELSVSPGFLQFQEGESEKQVELTVQATGAGSITITSLALEKQFSGFSPVIEPTESLNLSIPGGSSQTISRTLSLSAFDRNKALDGSQSGSFTASYRVEGQDAYGYPVDAVTDVPVTVTSATASTLQISGVELELPLSPYYIGDQITNARVRVQATGGGMVTGEILVDEEGDWSSENAFSVNVDGETVFDIEGELPTDEPGEHTVTVEVNDPATLTGEATYTVSDQRPPFPPEVLTLVPEVAELSDLDGTAKAVSNSSAGYEEFTFTGTAKMKLLSLENTELSDVTVTDLVVRYDNSNPTKAKIRGGTVEKEADGEEVFVSTADDYLKVKKVRFQGQPSPATDHILVDAKLAVPKLGGREIMMVEGLVVKTEGVEAKSFSYEENDPKSFDAFGMEFRIHDVDGLSNALVFGEDKANDRYYFALSGSIVMESKEGTTTEKDTLTTFEGLTFYTDAHIDGVITFSRSFDLIPDILEINKIKLKNIDEAWKLKLAGKLKGLPKPLTAMNDTEFEISFDKDGNASGGMIPLKELKKNQQGHELGEEGDESEWDFAIGSLDATYLQFVFEYQDGALNRDFSKILIGMDIYLNLEGEGGGEADDAGRRISFGELNTNGDFEGGIRLNMEGEFDWHSPTNAQILQNKQLTLPGINLTMDSLVVQTDPFGLAMTGSIVMGMSGVSGGIEFENLVVTIEGDISNLSDAITGGGFEVADSLKVEVDEIDWSTEPTSISFDSNETSGEGADRAPEKGSRDVAVESYVRLTGAVVNVGSTDEPVMSGGCDEFTFYDPVDGGRSFVVRNAGLETIDVSLSADVAYTEEMLTLAGSMTIPGDSLEAMVVGKFGQRDGSFTMGIFVAVSGLQMMVSPAVYLNGIGGGFFVNPVQDDIDLVHRLAGFERPELSDEITKNRPGGESNPGDFAVMLLGEFYVAQPDFLKGRALLTLTSNYFTLDAEASYAADVVEGAAYLAIGWSPPYAEGNIELELDFLSILKGEGSLGFYVYGVDTWAVNGSFNLYLYDSGNEIASGELFVGPPGLMVTAKVSQGVDWKVISGSISFEGMFWYWQQPASSKFGVYAVVTAKGEILKIASGEASLEGALIATPSLVIYSVGTVKLKVFGRKVWDGSMWVSAGMNGLDAGTGRNSSYDQMIEDARNMADEMEDTKDELLEDMDAARLELMKLSPEQMAAAGLILVEPGANLYLTWRQAFAGSELSYWQGNPPQPLPVIRSRLFGPRQQQLAAQRSDLEQQRSQVDAGIDQLDELQTEVVENFGEYEDLLLEDLPEIQDLGVAGSPFRGYETETVTVGGETKTVRVGFDLDGSKAEQQAQQLTSLREDFAAYQDAFIERAGRIDHTLRQLDRILYSDQYNLSELNTAYTEQYQRVNEYLQEYIDQQIEQKEYAEESLAVIDSAVNTSAPGGTSDGEAVIESINQNKAGTLTSQELSTWLDSRQHLIDLLLQQGGAEPSPLAEGISQEEAFVQRGTQLWWNIPVAGFEAMRDGCEERLGTLQDSFGGSLQAFRSTWSGTTTLADRVYDRKAALYALLHEIYDQLARFGSGEIGILGGGDAAGFGGSAAAGLGFRTSSAAAEISAQAFTLPAGSEPQGPTISPLRPAVQSAPLQGNLGEIAPSTSAPSQTAPRSPAPPQSTIGGTADGFSGRLLQKLPGGTGDTPFYGGERAVDTARKDTTTQAADISNWKWVPVNAYFRAKRQELYPYLSNPVFTTYDGTIKSDDQYSAVVEIQFAAEHPVEVVEYSWSITEPAADDGEHGDGDAGGSAGSGGSSSDSGFYSPYIVNADEMEMIGQTLADDGEEEQEDGGGGFLGFFGGAQIQVEMGLKLFIPWFSVGTVTELEDILLAGEFAPGTYALTVKARGAGGSSIIRRAQLPVDYFDPDTDTAPYRADIDTSDDTPPTTPLVNTDRKYIRRTDSLYASWSASDPESGIQRYEYTVVPFEEVSDLAEPSGGETAGTGQTSAPAQEWSVGGTGISWSGGGAVEAAAGIGGGSAGAGAAMDTAAAGEAAIPLSQSGAAQVQKLVQDDPRFDWQNARSLTEMNIRDLVLEQGSAYAVVIRAVNGAGLSSIGLSDAVTVDLTPPEAPEIHSFGQNTVSGQANSFRFNLGRASDPESGIIATTISLGTSDGSADLVPRTELEDAGGEGSSFALVNVPVSDGQTVHLTVRSVNGAEASTELGESVTVQFDDTTPPEPVEAALQPMSYTVDPDSLTVGWSSSADEESGITRYEFGLGSSPNEPDVTGWTTVQPEEEPRLIGLKGSSSGSGFGRSGGMGGTWAERAAGSSGSRGKVAVSGRDLLDERLMQEGSLEAEYQQELTDLGLQQGGRYYLLVRVINGAGLISETTAGPVTVDTTPPEQMQVREITVSKNRDRVELEVQARDPQSGITALRWEVVRGGHGVFSPSEVLSTSEWLSFSSPGTSRQAAFKRSIQVTLPASARGSGKNAPRVRVLVMNGAGLTANAGRWPAVSSGSQSRGATPPSARPGSSAAEAIGSRGSLPTDSYRFEGGK